MFIVLALQIYMENFQQNDFLSYFIIFTIIDPHIQFAEIMNIF